jgi:hypothetical protein
MICYSYQVVGDLLIVALVHVGCGHPHYLSSDDRVLNKQNKNSFNY